MASENLYQSFGEDEVAVGQDGGYQALMHYGLLSTFESLKTPGTAAALGDTKKIGTAHTFKTDEGFIALLCKLHSVTSKSETVGDEAAPSLQHSFEGIVLGDSAMHLEQFEALLRRRAVWLIRDQDCSANEYVQFGDACVQPTIKLEFTGNTTKEGLKEYKLTGTIKGHKFFYTSTVTEKPAAVSGGGGGGGGA